jgi:hypothetical protein
MEDAFTQIGVGGIFALLVIKSVFDFVSKRKNGNVDFAKMSHRIEALWELHDRRDRDGVPVWYTRQSMEETVQALRIAIAEQTEVFRRFALKQEDTQRALRSIGDRMDEMAKPPKDVNK